MDPRARGKEPPRCRFVARLRARVRRETRTSVALHSGGALAAAVSKAGALGSFGALHPLKGPDWLLNEIEWESCTSSRSPHGHEKGSQGHGRAV